jgi:hypothetical protein
MFIFDPLTQGLELLSQRELQKAERLFLAVINDPYSDGEENHLARKYLNEIRSCQNGAMTLDFEEYKDLAVANAGSLEIVFEFLSDLYFSTIETYSEFDEEIPQRLTMVINRLKREKIRDVIARDDLYRQINEKGSKQVQQQIVEGKISGKYSEEFDQYRWKTVFRKFVEYINPILLERHLELLEYVLETGEVKLLDDNKILVLTPKHRWIIESTLKSKWFLLRSYFFKAKSEIKEQFNKKEGTRKYWEEVKLKKIKIFEECGFDERNIQKFLYSDKLNYKTLEEIHKYARDMDLDLIPRDVSLALRGVDKSKGHIKERAGHLIGARKGFQEKLTGFGFSMENSYKIARQAKRANGCQISDTFENALKVARDEVYWYRVPPHFLKFRDDLEEQCRKHLSTVKIHLFERGRLNKLLLLSGKHLIRNFLVKVYGEDVVSLHCYFRLETVRQYYKLKWFQYHAEQFPSVSELIKISRKDFQPMVLEGFSSFIKKKRLEISATQMSDLDKNRSETDWEDPYTTAEEKALLKFWFLMDHGVNISQATINKGVLEKSFDFINYLKLQGSECNS